MFPEFNLCTKLEYHIKHLQIKFPFHGIKITKSPISGKLAQVSIRKTKVAANSFATNQKLPIVCGPFSYVISDLQQTNRNNKYCILYITVMLFCIRLPDVSECNRVRQLWEVIIPNHFDRLLLRYFKINELTFDMMVAWPRSVKLMRRRNLFGKCVSIVVYAHVLLNKKKYIIFLFFFMWYSKNSMDTNCGWKHKYWNTAQTWQIT